MNRAICLLLCTSLVFLTACSKKVEDPTDIELEVLRTTLLENELTIDKLHNSLDEDNETINKLNKTIKNLEKSLYEEQTKFNEILEGTYIKEPKKSLKYYYKIFDDKLLMVCKVDTVGKTDKKDILYAFSKENENKTIEAYVGSNVSFSLDKEYKLINVLDENKLLILDKEYNKVYSKDLKTIELADSYNLIQDEAYGKVYVVTNVVGRNELDELTDTIKKKETNIYSNIYLFDYSKSLGNIEIEKLTINALDYVYIQKDNTLLYEENMSHKLIALDLNTKISKTIIINSSDSFDLKVESDGIYYYNDNYSKYILYKTKE